MTLLVPADDGIVMIQNLTHHSVSLAEYISRDYLAQLEAASFELGYDSQYALVDGYDQLIKYLTKQAIDDDEQLHLNTIATRIKWRPGVRA